MMVVESTYVTAGRFSLCREIGKESFHSISSAVRTNSTEFMSCFSQTRIRLCQSAVSFKRVQRKEISGKRRRSQPEKLKESHTPGNLTPAHPNVRFGWWELFASMVFNLLAMIQLILNKFKKLGRARGSKRELGTP